MLRYRTNGPNHVHQLVVTVSKHLYITKTGEVKYQKKAIETNLKTIEGHERELILVYMVRDHCSGVIYFDIARSSEVLSAKEFLIRAWSPKSEKEFCGIPRAMTLPQTVASKFPDVRVFVEQLGVEVIEVTSGFQAGVIGIKDLDSLVFQWATQPVITVQGFRKADVPNFDKLRSYCPEVISYINEHPARTGKEKKIDLWRNSVGEIVPPTLPE